MSCHCQVANHDPLKPCPVCHEAPEEGVATGARTANEEKRIETLLKMTRGAK